MRNTNLPFTTYLFECNYVYAIVIHIYRIFNWYNKFILIDNSETVLLSSNNLNTVILIRPLHEGKTSTHNKILGVFLHCVQ